MANQLMQIPNQLPAYLQGEAAQKLAELNAKALGGIRAGGFPRISIKGGKFAVVENGERSLVKDDNGLPLMQLEVVIIDASPYISKTFYEGPYEEGSDLEPDCSSDDGVTPNPDVPNRQSSACAICPQNVWGSKITPQGKESKACSDTKRLVVVPTGDLTSRVVALIVTPASLREWAQYVKTLENRSIPIVACSTRVTFDPDAAFPKLNFGFARFLSETEFNHVQSRADTDEVKNIISTRRVVPIAPTQAAPAPQSLLEKVTQAAAAAVTQAAQPEEKRGRGRPRKEPVAETPTPTPKPAPPPEPQPAPATPPGVDPEQYKAFLAFQEAQKKAQGEPPAPKASEPQSTSAPPASKTAAAFGGRAPLTVVPAPSQASAPTNYSQSPDVQVVGGELEDKLADLLGVRKK